MAIDMGENLAATVIRPLPATLEELAAMIDHHLLDPGLNDEEVHAGCQLGREWSVASVCVRPSDADLAVRLLSGSRVTAASVVGFPHGGATTAAKLYEARDLLRRGIREIDMVVNIGKLIARQFQYLESEILQVAQACQESGALLKVIFENAYLSEDLKVIACKICKRAEADFVVTSTGFGLSGHTPEDLILMKRVVKDLCRVKASGGVDTLPAVLDAHRLGCDRFGTSATAGILRDWQARLKAEEGQDAAGRQGTGS